jgi:hypothetical protein
VNRKFFLVSAVAVLTGLFIYTACTKVDTTDIGNDLIPTVDNVNTFDTVLDVITDNFIYPDSTLLGRTELHSIGSIANDPEFGETEAAAYFSLTPGSYGSYPFPVVADSVTAIDSVILSLPYNSLYGDSNSIEQFEVFEIDPTGFKDSIYRIDATPFNLLPGMLGSKTVDFKTLNDSVFYVNFTSTTATVRDTVRTINQLRIPLDASLADKLMNFDTANQYKTDSAFRTHFKGLAVRVNKGASPAPNALAYFSLTGDASATVTMYYKIQKGGQIDTTSTSFAYSSGANRNQANLVKRTPGNNFLTYLNNGNPSDDLAFIQSTPGSYVSVKIPGLPGLSNRVIHRAELILEKIPSLQDNFYTPPPILFIDGVNATGDSTFTIRNDFVFTGQGLGYDVGSLEGILRNNTKYMFNLSRYVQSIVTKKLRSHTLRVYAPYAVRPYFENGNGVVSAFPPLTEFVINTPIAANRVVVGGGSHPTNKMRLRIIYSKI